MTEAPPRQKRTSPSNPKLVEAGWDRLDPTELIDRASQHVRDKVQQTSDAITRTLSTPPKPVR